MLVARGGRTLAPSTGWGWPPRFGFGAIFGFVVKRLLAGAIVVTVADVEGMVVEEEFSLLLPADVSVVVASVAAAVAAAVVPAVATRTNAVGCPLVPGFSGEPKSLGVSPTPSRGIFSTDLSGLPPISTAAPAGTMALSFAASGRKVSILLAGEKRGSSSLERRRPPVFPPKGLSSLVAVSVLLSSEGLAKGGRKGAPKILGLGVSRESRG